MPYKIEEQMKQVVIVRKDLRMRAGKMAAQVAHASMMFITTQFPWDIDESEKLTYPVHLTYKDRVWLAEGFTKIVAGVDSLDELLEIEYAAEKADIRRINRVVDKGLTEFRGRPTLTCICLGPDREELINTVTGHLRLL
jgi:PTH2 family peptidyl-tRNA hydrolase